jgi:hypothetical protein
MPRLNQHLDLARCPHCHIDQPNLSVAAKPITTHGSDWQNQRVWLVYCCEQCGGLVTAAAQAQGEIVSEFYPHTGTFDNSIPEKARNFLVQCAETIHSPSASIVMAASAVDAMLKLKSYKEGGLHSRIVKAAEDHLITKEMAAWAHDVRLDANDERHADEKAKMPSSEDAKRCLEFAKAFAQFLFILPDKVKRGRDAAKVQGTKRKSKSKL